MHLQKKFELSERRACKVIGQPRSTRRYTSHETDEDGTLLGEIVALPQKVNKERVHRLWREAGLKVPQKRHKKRRRLGVGENGCTRRRAEHAGHVWSYDFVMDRTEDGRRLKILVVVDEYTRECLSTEVERSITAEDVVSTPAPLFWQRGEPAFIRSGNGPEFIAGAVEGWLEASGVKTLYIEPGSPWENAYSETFISRLGDELLLRGGCSAAYGKRKCW